LVGKALYWTTAMLATRIIVSSAAVRERFPPWARSKIEVVHNGVDLGRFRPDRDRTAIRQQFGIPAKVPLVGCVARFIPWKGVDQFVRIAARVRDEVPDAHFLIAGSRLAGYEQYTADVRALIAELGLAGCTTVLEDSLAVPELMAAMDVFVHCSTRPEPFGIVIVEAMATGKPVVAINAGGVPEIVSEPDVGVLVPIGEIEPSARAVIGLLLDPARANALGQAARAHVARHFDVQAVTRRVEAIYATARPATSAAATVARASRSATTGPAPPT
jgi:glycosyltransferase involved in cell wall biosynthesis